MTNKCIHDPRETKGPIGMYHCPNCSEMVLAGIAHPDYDRVNNLVKEDEELVKGIKELTLKEQWENKIKCNYIKCFAGTGVAGNGNCFLKGDISDKNCNKFLDDNEEQKRLEKINQGEIK